MDPNKLASDAAAEAQQAEAWAALNLGQRWWWAISLGALVLGFVVGKL